MKHNILRAGRDSLESEQTPQLEGIACSECEHIRFEHADFISERTDFRSERAQDIFECERKFCVQAE